MRVPWELTVSGDETLEKQWEWLYFTEDVLKAAKLYTFKWLKY